MKKLALTVFALSLFASPAFGQAMGRFQLVDTRLDTYLLDTETGNTWEMVVLTAPDGRKYEAWSPKIIFRSFEQRNSFVERLRQEAKDPALEPGTTDSTPETAEPSPEYLRALKEQGQTSGIK